MLRFVAVPLALQPPCLEVPPPQYWKIAGSNARPTDCQAAPLTTTLQIHIKNEVFVFIKICKCRYINYKICAESLLLFSEQQLRLAENPPLLVWWIFCMVTLLTDKQLYRFPPVLHTRTIRCGIHTYACTLYNKDRHVEPGKRWVVMYVKLQHSPPPLSVRGNPTKSSSKS